MKKAFNILVYISLGFLIYYLYRNDYFRLEGFSANPFYLGFSILLLFTGFVLQSLCWWKAMRVHGFPRNIRESIISHGQAIFAKYIPGKLWVILGRAGYLTSGRKDFKDYSFVSLKEQLIYIWAGLLISAVPVFIYYGFRWMSAGVAGIALLLSLVLFSKGINRFIFSMAGKILRRSVEFPLINFRRSLPIVFFELIFWCVISFGFLIFIAAIAPPAVPVMAFAFPLSICLGILAIILPGGLGVREGVLAGFLVLAGMDLPTATTLSVFSRIWYIIGEVFIFGLASILRMKQNFF